jgi:hypothetical protein
MYHRQISVQCCLVPNDIRAHGVAQTKCQRGRYYVEIDNAPINL